MSLGRLFQSRQTATLKAPNRSRERKSLLTSWRWSLVSYQMYHISEKRWRGAIKWLVHEHAEFKPNACWNWQPVQFHQWLGDVVDERANPTSKPTALQEWAAGFPRLKRASRSRRWRAVVWSDADVQKASKLCWRRARAVSFSFPRRTPQNVTNAVGQRTNDILSVPTTIRSCQTAVISSLFHQTVAKKWTTNNKGNKIKSPHFLPNLNKDFQTREQKCA